MLLESLDVIQVMTCNIGQDYVLHKIQEYKVLGFVHYDNYAS